MQSKFLGVPDTYPQEFREYLNTETGLRLENSERKKMDGSITMAEEGH